MTLDDYIDLLVSPAIEGGFANDPADHGGATAFGITSVSWGLFKRMGRPATVDQMQRLTRADAVGYYQGTLAASPFRVVACEPLRVALIDFGVNSGTARAARWLQRAIGVPVNDGVLDDRTLKALALLPGTVATNALVAARVRMYRDIVAADATQERFLAGWINRALRFAVLDPVA